MELDAVGGGVVGVAIGGTLRHGRATDFHDQIAGCGALGWKRQVEDRVHARDHQRQVREEGVEVELTEVAEHTASAVDGGMVARRRQADIAVTTEE